MRLALPSLLVLSLLAPLPASAQPNSGPLADLTIKGDGYLAGASSADSGIEAILGPSESVTIAEIGGPAVIERIWLGIEGADSFWRDLVLEITWDDASGPSVQAPVGDFFAVGPGPRQEIQSLPLVVQSAGRSMTSYWEMPVRRKAVVKLRNEGVQATRQLRWDVTWRKVDRLPKDSMLFHAQYRQAGPADPSRPFQAATIRGDGQMVGLSMAVQNAEPGAWGTGEIVFQADGGRPAGPGRLPLLNYFGHLFGVGQSDGPSLGATVAEGTRVGARNSVYRFHLSDPVPFSKALDIWVFRGVGNRRGDRMAGVTYWYQSAPAAAPGLPDARLRRWKAPDDAKLEAWKRADEIDEEVLAAYRRNDFAQARRLLEELIELEPDSVYASYNLACLYALEGDEAKALHMLEQAIELGFTELSFARQDPDLASLHAHERFRRIVEMP
jgi:hypothetical protein